MQYRRDMKYSLLITETIQQVSKSYVRVIKQCIESLVQQEYLEFHEVDGLKCVRYIV